ncbi:MAG: HAD family hydrolase [Pseudomonadota bacterium]
MTGQIRALLFDKDGTLFDFDATWGKVTARVIEHFAPDPALAVRLGDVAGFELATRRFAAGSPIVAGATTETAMAWAGLLGIGVGEIARGIDRIVAESTGPDMLAPAAPDLPGLLMGLRAEGYALGVATHDSAGNAELQLETVGARQTFAFVAGYDSGHGLKPGPGMLLAFAEAVGVAPGEVAMIGDSIGDLQVAPNAGAALAIGVLTGPAEEADLAPHADHVLRSIADLPALLRDL